MIRAEGVHTPPLCGEKKGDVPLSATSSREQHTPLLAAGLLIAIIAAITLVSCETTENLEPPPEEALTEENLPDEMLRESILVEAPSDEEKTAEETLPEEEFSEALISEDDLLMFEQEAALAEEARLAQEAAEAEAARLEAQRLEEQRIEEERLAREAARRAQEAASAQPPPAPAAPAVPPSPPQPQSQSNVPATPVPPVQQPPAPALADTENDDEEAAKPIEIPVMPDEENPVPTRTLQVPVNKAFDVRLPGTNWMFLGEIEKPNIIRYIKRDNLFNETVFSLLAEKEGRAIVQFYRQDAIANAGQNEYIEIIASAETQSPQETLTDAPVSANTQSNTQSNSPQTAQNQSAPNLPQLSPEKQAANALQSKLAQAKQAYSAQDFDKAAALIGEFLDMTEDALDEGLFLKGQIYEAKSPVRNIKTALAAYEELVNNMPFSPLVKNAKERIAYIKRFYY